VKPLSCRAVALVATGALLSAAGGTIFAMITPGLAAAEPTTGAAPTADAAPPDVRRFEIGPGATPVPSTASDADGLTVGPVATDSWSGYLPDGTTLTPFDASSQLLARLDPALLTAIQGAARTASAQGIDITITSGWRSKGFQQRLFDDAVRRYGNVEIAQQFVASPETSMHVVGEAVDIAGNGASGWLIRNGAQFGLCQIYANENWHFELATDGEGRCPPLRPDAAG
jgi:D-alanyl-D-alanine carboxypeptidase